MSETATPNKVKYGLKNVHYARVTFGANGAPTFETPVEIPGAVNLSMNRSGSNVVFYASDGVYFEIGDNQGMDGDLEIALIPDDFRTDCLGESQDSNGVLSEGAELTLGHFALLFEFTEDVKAVRHVLYNCTAREGTVAGATKRENIEVQTETLNLSAKPLPGGGKVKARTSASTTSTVYDSWYESVYTGPAASG